MKIIVNTKNYTPFKYYEYFDGGTQQNNPYVVGQVVAVKINSKEELAVVLGVITKNEVRVDLCGMIAIEDIRPATIKDLSNPNVLCVDRLRKEIEGYKVNYNWNTYELTVE